MEDLKSINLLIAIVAANPGIIVSNTEMKDIARDVWRATGTIIGTKPEADDYPSKTLDWHGKPYINQRINRRKFALRIISYGE